MSNRFQSFATVSNVSTSLVGWLVASWLLVGCYLVTSFEQKTKLYWEAQARFGDRPDR